jgi:hypothetical protein
MPNVKCQNPNESLNFYHFAWPARLSPLIFSFLRSPRLRNLTLFASCVVPMVIGIPNLLRDILYFQDFSSPMAIGVEMTAIFLSFRRSQATEESFSCPGFLLAALVEMTAVARYAVQLSTFYSLLSTLYFLLTTFYLLLTSYFSPMHNFHFKVIGEADNTSASLISSILPKALAKCKAASQ